MLICAKVTQFYYSKQTLIISILTTPDMWNQDLNSIPLALPQGHCPAALRLLMNRAKYTLAPIIYKLSICADTFYTHCMSPILIK